MGNFPRHGGRDNDVDADGGAGTVRLVRGSSARPPVGPLHPGRRGGWERHASAQEETPNGACATLDRLYALAVGLLRARHVRGIEADDLVQEACLALERGPRPPDPVRHDAHAQRGWEAAVLTNRLKELLRHRSVRERASGAGRCGPFGPADAACGGGFSHVDEALDPPLAALPEGLRPAAALMLAGLSAGEAARALSLAEAELRRGALLAAWMLAEGEPPALDPAGAIPRRASLRGPILLAVLRRRRAGWGWDAIGHVLGVTADALQQAAKRWIAQNTM